MNLVYGDIHVVMVIAKNPPIFNRLTNHKMCVIVLNQHKPDISKHIEEDCNDMEEAFSLEKSFH